MDPGIHLLKENPRQSANFLSVLCFTWTINLFRKGLKNGLKIIDLYKVLDYDQSKTLGDKLDRNWTKELSQAKIAKKSPNLYNALFKTFILHYMFYGILLFAQFVILRSLQPIILGYLIYLFSLNTNEPNVQTKMYISAGLLVFISLIIAFFCHHCNFGQSSIGMRVRVAVSSLIYRKILKLSKKSMGQTAAGQVVNLLSNDVARFDQLSIALHFIWISPFHIAIITFYVWDQVGISCLAGVLSMLLFTLPTQGYLSKISSRLRWKVATKTDNRVRLMNEIISGIQVIKMYAWEKPFEKLVEMARATEIKTLTQASYIRGIFMSCMVFIERTTLYLTVITYVLLGNVITADKVFSMAQFFNILQLSMAIFLPMAISIGAETIVSVQRLRTFLMLDEKESTLKITNEDKISLRNVNAAWNDEITLNEITLQIPAGKLCAIIGSVGCGKSSLLNLLLGEMPLKSGNISIPGRISYSSQEPWLFASSVRNNILFGQKYEIGHYQRVTKACALLPDFNQFPEADRTLVGERGVSLSGGQRARINLARAVYRDADIYLLDDPLSAVDTHVGKHLFQECILKYLRGKTRILITHQVQHIREADIIVVLNNGRIEFQGTYEELIASELDFGNLASDKDQTADNETDKPMMERKQSIISSKSSNEEEAQSEIAREEEMSLSNKSPIKEYVMAAGSWCTLLAAACIIILSQVACNAADLWVSYWTEQEALLHDNNTNYEQSIAIFTIDNILNIFNDNELKSKNSTNNLLEEYAYITNVDEPIDAPINTFTAVYIYTALIILLIFLTLIRSAVFYKLCMIASKNLHLKMFHSLLEAPMSFFNLNSSGKILNRFSKDMGTVDESLPRVAIEAMQILLVMSGILVMVVISNYYMLLVIIICSVFFMILRKWFIETVRTVKHIEGIAKSPVFSHINSSLNGITTIRACGTESVLIQEFDKLQDVHTSAFSIFIACISAYGLWIDLVCVLFTGVIIFSFILLNQEQQFSGSMVGLAISQSLILTGMLQHGMKQSAEVVSQMTSVERIIQYTSLEKEGPFESTKDENLPKGWPLFGNIIFSHVYLQYSVNDPPVLKDLNLEIKSGSKVGIVGRTGAGKSSLISALFRLAPVRGLCKIDDINTEDLGLNTLRRCISIIPQEPVLFAASLRYNLDPFGEFDDKYLWSALEEVELKCTIASLDFVVEEGGSNFSLGQRQLICLARAILRNNKVLVLDEATANVDHRTDSLIQNTIKRKFKNCTVLTIAHRLNTIMDSDKVLVLDGGRMVEFDHPNVLLQNEGSSFTKLVEETGPTMTKILRQIASEAYYHNKNREQSKS